jgi:threonine synthase
MSSPFPSWAACPNEAANGELARTDVEPTCASSAAALGKLLDAGVVLPEETTMLVLTGTDLKAIQRIGELMNIVP